MEMSRFCWSPLSRVYKRRWGCLTGWSFLGDGGTPAGCRTVFHVSVSFQFPASVIPQSSRNYDCQKHMTSHVSPISCFCMCKCNTGTFLLFWLRLLGIHNHESSLHFLAPRFINHPHRMPRGQPRVLSGLIRVPLVRKC